MDEKCQKQRKTLAAWPDTSDPAFAEGAIAAAAGVPLDMRYGHVWVAGWVTQKFQSQPPSLKRH